MQRTRHEVLRMLRPKIKFKTNRVSTYTWMTKNKDVTFMHQILKPILRAQRGRGQVFQVGRGERSKRINFVPFLYTLCLDSKETHVLTCTFQGKRKCRMCLAQCNIFHPDYNPEQRSVQNTCQVQRLSEKVWKKKMVKGTVKLTEDERAVSNLLVIFSNMFLNIIKIALNTSN